MKYMADSVKFRVGWLSNTPALQDTDIPVNNKQSIGVRATTIVRTFSLSKLLKTLWRLFI